MRWREFVSVRRPSRSPGHPSRRSPGRSSGHRRFATPALAAAFALLVTGPLFAAPHAPLVSDAELDRQVLQVLEQVVAGDIAPATVLAGALARRYPRFMLGQLLHAELSAVAALDDTRVGSEQAWSPALIELLLEAQARLATPHAPTRPVDDMTVRPDPPAPFIQIGRGIEHVVLVDLERATLALHAVADGATTPVRRHYVSSGSAGYGKRREGDRKTPLGLFRITRVGTDDTLPELYGAGALVLDYPNAFDRAQGRTGSGIWLHGVPRTRRSRAPRSSEGCVTMSNEHLVALGGQVDPAHTLVLLGASPRVEHRAEKRDRYRALFLDWRDAAATEAADLPWLAGVDVRDVTILETTVDGLPGEPDLLVMDVRPALDTGTADTVQGSSLTLWWSRDETQGWLVTLEDIVTGDT